MLKAEELELQLQQMFQQVAQDQIRQLERQQTQFQQEHHVHPDYVNLPRHPKVQQNQAKHQQSKNGKAFGAFDG